MRFKGKMSNFGAKNTIKLGEKQSKGQMAPLSRMYWGRGGGSGEAGGGGKRKKGSAHPSQKGVLDPPSYGTFSTPLRCQCSVLPVQKSTTEQTRSSFGGVQKFFRESAFSGTFPPPIRFAPPPCHRPNFLGACYRKAMTPKKLWTFTLFLQILCTNALGV